MPANDVLIFSFPSLPDSSEDLGPAWVYHIALLLFMQLVSFVVQSTLWSVGSSRGVLQRHPMKDLHGLSRDLLRGLCPLTSQVPKVAGSDLRGLQIRGLLASTLLLGASMSGAKGFSSSPTC